MVSRESKKTFQRTNSKGTHLCPTQTKPPLLFTSSTALSTPFTSGATVNILNLSLSSSKNPLP